MIEIDGSRESGSGAIVRDAVSFSVLLGKDLHIKNIRAIRDKPGLRPQHLKAGIVDWGSGLMPLT